MDPLEKLWLFNGWVQKNKINVDILRDHAIFTGSFSNLEMAKQVSKKPDYSSSDEDWDKSWDYIQSQPVKDSALKDINKEGFRNSKRRNRRRKVVE